MSVLFQCRISLTMCASSSWDFWKTPEISFFLTAVPTLQPAFMQGRIQDFGNGGPISVNSSYLLGIYPRIPNSHSRKTPTTHKKIHQIYPPPPDMWFPQSTKSRINTKSNIWGRNPNWGREACEDWWRSPRKGGKPLARNFLRFKLKMVQVGVYLEHHSFI